MSAGRGLRVSWVDVFTERPFAGNQLAVVLDADELGDDAMLAIAREFNLSETVFVVEECARLRIFTPGGEIPLAGHPVVGASLELARLGRIPSEGGHVFRTGVGETPVEISGGVATMTQAEPRLGLELDPQMVARALGLSPGDLADQPVISNTGLDQGFAQVRDRDALARLEPDLAAVRALESLGIVAWAGEEPGVLAQRYFVPQLGIAEDAATGSAAGALGALRVFRGAEPGRVTVHQGVEMGRPSTIQVEVSGAPGRAEQVRVGGRAVPILEAMLNADGA